MTEKAKKTAWWQDKIAELETEVASLKGELATFDVANLSAGDTVHKVAMQAKEIAGLEDNVESLQQQLNDTWSRMKELLVLDACPERDEVLLPFMDEWKVRTEREFRVGMWRAMAHRQTVLGGPFAFGAWIDTLIELAPVDP